MTEKKRMPNMELLRCLAMMMVVVLHYLGKGKVLPVMTSETVTGSVWLGWTGTIAWMLEALAIVAVNIYMLISGYFLCTSSFKLSRLLSLWIQLWLYSVLFGVLGAELGIVAETSVDTHYFLTLLFPVTMGHYWFMTAYIFLYVCLPLVGTAVKRMTKHQLATAWVLLLVVFSVLKSVLPFRLESDLKGYDFVWYLCVFVAAAYVRRFGLPLLEKRGRALCLYGVSCVLILAGTFALRFLYLKTGSLSRIITICFEYNHILPFLGALGLFIVFMKVKVPGKIAGVIYKIAPHTLGVYLLHENLGLRYTWENWLGADKIDSVSSLLLRTVLAVMAVFAAGILVDMILKGALHLVHAVGCRIGGYRKVIESIQRVDGYFRES